MDTFNAFWTAAYAYLRYQVWLADGKPVYVPDDEELADVCACGNSSDYCECVEIEND